MMMLLRRRAFVRLLGPLLLLPKVSRGDCLPPGDPVLPPALPVHDSSDPLAAAFLEAILADSEIAVFYHGGSTPGAFRRFRPNSLFRLRPGGPVYARGRCRLREADRTLRLDRCRLA